MNNNITGEKRKRDDDSSDGPLEKKRKVKDMSFTANKRLIFNYLFGQPSRKYGDDIITNYDIHHYNKFILNEVIHYNLLKNIEVTFISYLFKTYSKKFGNSRIMYREKILDSTVLHILNNRAFKYLFPFFYFFEL